MSGEEQQNPAVPEQAEEEQQYEGTPEELTAFHPGPAWFDRKKVMMTLCIVFAAAVMGGIVFNSRKPKDRETADESGQAARAPREFLNQELSRSLREKPETADGLAEIQDEDEGNTGLPEAVPYSGNAAARTGEPAGSGSNAPPPPPGGGGSGSGSPSTANFSPLVPSVEGSLFPASAAANPGASYAEQYPYLPPGGGPTAMDYLRSPYASPTPMQAQDSFAAQNNQADKKTFYDAGSGGSAAGVFLGENLLWIGTIIPAVLETAVNTDLPGNVIARVSQNVYDSRTGKKLLIPQGTVLVAKYNSSVSYAQHRVQIVWDILIRPDGYQLELEGMNGVDPKGMSGLKAEYHENWFEYLKAAGIITMFSLANSKMAEEAAKYGTPGMAANVTSSNAEFVNQMGGNIVSRAMNVQPTLTIQNGEKINVMINKNMYLPPVEDYPVTQRYILK